MTANKRFKRAVRQRAAKTGESYTAALQHFRAKPGGQRMISCTFCGKPKTEVKKIVAGPGVYICNVCVELCVDVIAQVDTPPHPDVPRQSQPAPERMLEWLPAMAKTHRSIEADVAQRVADLRAAGIGWDRIAAALGVDEAEARERYGGI